MDFESTPLAAAIFLGAIAACAGVDLYQRRIPNRLVGPLAVLALAWVGGTQGWVALLLALVSGVVVVLALWVPWERGGIGGGDVKLAAAAAMGLGHERLVAFSLVGALAGGVVAAVAYLASKREARAEMKSNVLMALVFRAWPRVPAAAPGRVSVPYGLAVLAGSAYAMVAPPWGWPP